jgi:hypothetical protein
MRKIFIGLVNIASNITELKYGFEALGYETLTAVLEDSPIQHTVVEYNIPKMLKKSEETLGRQFNQKERDLFINKILREVWDRAIIECDTFFFIWRSFRLDNKDFIDLKKHGKKIIVMFVGSDIRYIPAMYQEFAKYNLPKNDELQAYMEVPLINKLHCLRMAERYADIVFSHPEMGQLALRPYHTVGIPLGLEKFNANFQQNEKPLVIHAPLNRGGKGTKHVLKAFEELQLEGILFDIELIENLPNAEALKRYSEADILVGQLFSTVGGRQEIEVFACGTIVLTGYHPEYIFSHVSPHSRYYQQIAEYPAISVTPDTLKNTLRELITDYPRRKELAKKVRPYIEKYNNTVDIARHIARIVSSDKPEYDFIPKYFRDEYIPEPENLELYNKYTTLVSELPWFREYVMSGMRDGLLFPCNSKNDKTQKKIDSEFVYQGV